MKIIIVFLSLFLSCGWTDSLSDSEEDLEGKMSCLYSKELLKKVKIVSSSEIDDLFTIPDKLNGSNTCAITFCNYIFIRQECRDEGSLSFEVLLAHELKHVEQQSKGCVKYGFSYAKEYIKNRFKKNSHDAYYGLKDEEKARAAEKRYLKECR